MENRYRNYLCGLIFLVLGGLSTTVFAQPGATAYEEAERYRNNKEYTEAIGKYAQAIAKEPENYNYYFKKGLCELIIRNYEDAILSFRSAVRVNPEFTEGYVYLTKIYINRKDYARAVYYLGKSYDTEKDPAKQLGYKLAIIKFLILLDKRQEALQEIEATKPLAENNYKLWFIEGQIHGKMGNWDLALTSYQQALNLATDAKAPASLLAKYKYSVGLAHFKLGNQEEFSRIQKDLDANKQTHYANKLKNSKLVSNYQGAGFYMRLAKSYLRANAYEEALHWAQKAVNKSLETTATAHKMVGYIHFKAGQYHLAVESYQQAAGFESDPNSLVDIYLTLLKLEHTNRNYIGVLAAANKLASLSPQNAEIYYYESLALQELGLHNWAAAVAAKGAQIATQKEQTNLQIRPLCYYQMGRAAKNAGLLSLAKTGYKKAKALEALKLAADMELKYINKPDSIKHKTEIIKLKKQFAKQNIASDDTSKHIVLISSINELANSYLTANHISEANAWVRDAFKINTNNALTYRMEGKIYYQAGLFWDANRSFQKSLHLETDPAKREKLYETTIKLCYNLGDDLGVLRLANQFMEINNHDAEILYLKALAEYNLKLYTASARSVENAAKLIPEKDLNSTRAYYLFTIALACKKAGQAEKARETFKKIKFTPLKVAATYEIQTLTTR